MLNAFNIEGVTVIGVGLLDGLIFSDKTERNGLPNGAIQAA